MQRNTWQKASVLLAVLDIGCHVGLVGPEHDVVRLPRQQIGERDAAEVVADERAGGGTGGLEGGNAGVGFDRDVSGCAYNATLGGSEPAVSPGVYTPTSIYVTSKSGAP